MEFSILLLLVVTAPVGKSYPTENDYKETENANYQCGANESKNVKFQCLCGSGKEQYIFPMELKRLPEVNESALATPAAICSSHSCTLIPSDYLRGNPKSSFIKSFLFSVYPIEFEVPAGGFKDTDSGNRFARDVSSCVLAPLQNAAIRCWKWPNWKNCDIVCVHGYGIQIGSEVVTKTNVNCRDTENKWKPQAIQDCKPFFNCKVKLVKPGDLMCRGPSDKPAYCDISCMDYDSQDGTPLQRYECVSDEYAQMLPHCAAIEENREKLIKKPTA